MSSMAGKGPLDIKKYPNRRYYDATRSQHITLNDLYDLILEGYEIRVTETRNDVDITNLVLIQIFVERQQLKLDLFPAAILHMLIRSRPQAFQSTIEQYFSPFMNVFTNSQQQLEEQMRKTFGTSMSTPMQWANNMMQAFNPSQQTESTPNQVDDRDVDSKKAPTEPSADIPTSKDESIDELRQQAAALLERIDNLSVANQTTSRES